MPNSNELGIDFTTAFGRLLRDGLLRDALARDPQGVVAGLGVREEDQPALRQLVPEDLEHQAEVLLRKRLGLVRHIIPETAGRLQDELWPVFHRYARSHWPAGSQAALTDACDFADFLKSYRPAALCAHELNRLEFARGQKWLAVHWVRRKVGTEQRNGWMLQILWQTGLRRNRSHELFFYFKF